MIPPDPDWGSRSMTGRDAAGRVEARGVSRRQAIRGAPGGVAAEAGYDGIEPWFRDLDRYVEEGGSLRDLGARIRDAGLTVPSSIGFAKWAVDDDQERATGLEEAKRNMSMLVEIG